MQTPGASVIGQTLHISLQPRPGSSQTGASTGRNLKKKKNSLIPRIKDGWFQGLEHFSATTAGTLDSTVPLAPESQVYLPWQFSCFLRFITLYCTSEPGRDSVSLHALAFIGRLRLEAKTSLSTRVVLSLQDNPKRQHCHKPLHPLPIPSWRAAPLRGMFSPLHPDRLIWVRACLILQQENPLSRMEQVASLPNLF